MKLVCSKSTSTPINIWTRDGWPCAGYGVAKMIIRSRTILAAMFLCGAAVVNASVGDELAAAARDGKLVELRTLLENGVDVDVRQPDGTSALHWAVLGGHH